MPGHPEAESMENTAPRSWGVSQVKGLPATMCICPLPQNGQHGCSMRATRHRKSATDSTVAGDGAGDERIRMNVTAQILGQVCRTS